MKLNYFDLLSSEPIQIQNVGGIVSPKLRDICHIGYDTYQFYLTILTLDLNQYLKMIEQEDFLSLLPDKKKNQTGIFEMMFDEEHTRNLLKDALNFFIKEDVVYYPDKEYFLVQKDNKDIGIITREIYPQLCDLICQCNCINSNVTEDLSKIKNKKALEIMKKLQKGRAEKAKQTKKDKNMELANIISAVANKSNSLNIINIWDLTIFQLWDCFSRLSNNSIYDIQSMSVATWGDKDNHFDASLWFKRIDTDN